MKAGGAFAKRLRFTKGRASMTTKNRSIESDAAKDAASAAYDREVAAAAKRQADYESLVFNMGIVKAPPPAPPPCVGQGKDRQGAR